MPLRLEDTDTSSPWFKPTAMNTFASPANGGVGLRLENTSTKSPWFSGGLGGSAQAGGGMNNDAMRAARSNQSLQNRMMGRSGSAYNQVGMAGQGLLATGQNLVGQGMQSYVPMVNTAASLATRSPQWAIDRAANDAAAAFDASRQDVNRNLSDLGVNPNSGRFAGMQNRWGMARAAGIGGAKTRARETADSEQFNRIMQAAGLSRGLLDIGSGLQGQGASALGNAAGGWGQIGQEAGGLAGEAGQFAANVANRQAPNDAAPWDDLIPKAQSQTMDRSSKPSLNSPRQPTVRYDNAGLPYKSSSLSSSGSSVGGSYVPFGPYGSVSQGGVPWNFNSIG